MAITIKNIPILKKSAADRFDKKAKSSVANKSSVNFSRQIEASSKILSKAKI